MTKTSKQLLSKRQKRKKASDRRRKDEQSNRQGGKRHPSHKGSDNDSSRKDVALQLGKAGLSVVPLHDQTDELCACGDLDCEQPGNRPLTENGIRDATTDRRVIEHWWEKWPDASPGIVIGGNAIAVVTEGAAGQATEKKTARTG
jgi:hypothetical protein